MANPYLPLFLGENFYVTIDNDEHRGSSGLPIARSLNTDMLTDDVSSRLVYILAAVLSSTMATYATLLRIAAASSGKMSKS